ncbi:hypothetical protein, partial [Helicobacter pylori]|uniref:hypothetical protein n=1 Tax=Helicobacter pylori TaxID=210 RepID=UPI0019D5C899
LLENQRFTETITLSPKKADSKYNDLQERLPLLRFMACSLQCWCPIMQLWGVMRFYNKPP